MNVQSGIRRREAFGEARCRTVFEMFADSKTMLLRKEQVRNALKEIYLGGLESNYKHLLHHDICSTKAGLSFEEFKALLSQQHPIEQWADTLPFCRMLADAIPVNSEMDPLRAVSNLSREDISNIIDGLSESLKSILENHVLLLSKGLEAAENATHVGGSKFQIVPMNCGRLHDFHNGLEGRLGASRLTHARAAPDGRADLGSAGAGAPSLNFLAAMRQEHCDRSGCRDPFTTSNYGIRTCPADEWAAVAGDHADWDSRGGRVVPRPEALVDGEPARRAGLRLEEVYAVVLYTGPMVRSRETRRKKEGGGGGVGANLQIRNIR